MIVHIVGPMRGHRFYNFPAFDAARDTLRAAGYTVTSPADMDRAAGFDPATLPADHGYNEEPQGFDMRAAILRDVAAVIDADMVYALPGCEHSRGACAEIAVAAWAGVPVTCDVARLVANAPLKSQRGTLNLQGA